MNTFNILLAACIIANAILVSAKGEQKYIHRHFEINGVAMLAIGVLHYYGVL